MTDKYASVDKSLAEAAAEQQILKRAIGANNATADELLEKLKQRKQQKTTYYDTDNLERLYNRLNEDYGKQEPTYIH